MTPAILYALQQTSKQGPIHHIVRELDPESTKDFPEKGDYLSLQNKIKAIVGRTKASQKQLSRRTLAEQCGFMNHPFRGGLPKVQAASKKSGMESGKKRKASNEGKDDSYPFYLPAFLFSNSPFFLDTTNIDSIKTDHPPQARR